MKVGKDEEKKKWTYTPVGVESIMIIIVNNSHIDLEFVILSVHVRY